MPSIEENAKGDAYLQGGFDLGEGKYHVDWLMRDRTERVCSAFGTSDADIARPRTRTWRSEMAPGVVQGQRQRAVQAGAARWSAPSATAR